MIDFWYQIEILQVKMLKLTKVLVIFVQNLRFSRFFF